VTGRDPDWELLNAYVDGELDTAERARVADAVARDQELAHAVAVLSRLKQAAQNAAWDEIGEVPTVELPRKSRRPAWAAVAAALLLAAGLGLAAGIWPGKTAPQWLDQARAMHARWAVGAPGEPAGKASTASALILAAVEDFRRVPFVPDLSAGKLTLTSIDTTRIAESPALRLGYRGTRGCRVSLLILADPGQLPAELARFDTKAGAIYLWRAGGLGYAMLASSMDPARFQLLAETAHRTTHAHSQPDDRTRMALAESRANSKPCRA
jgi:anti-sigma factor RsiW